MKLNKGKGLSVKIMISEDPPVLAVVVGGGWDTRVQELLVFLVREKWEFKVINANCSLCPEVTLRLILIHSPQVARYIMEWDQEEQITALRKKLMRDRESKFSIEEQVEEAINFWQRIKRDFGPAHNSESSFLIPLSNTRHDLQHCFPAEHLLRHQLQIFQDRWIQLQRECPWFLGSVCVASIGGSTLEMSSLPWVRMGRLDLSFLPELPTHLRIPKSLTSFNSEKK